MQKSESELRTEDTKAPEEVKTRSRLSSAFRSLRSKKKVVREREVSSGTEDPRTPQIKRKSKFSLSGIKAKTKVHPTTLKTKDDYLTATSDTTPSHKLSPKKSLKKKLKSKKLIVTEDPSDIPPVNQAPPKPDRSYTGAVRKVTTTVNNSQLMKREDRGSRFPRPSSATEEDQSASASSSPPKHSFEPIEPQPSQSKDSQSTIEPTGNNIQNPNLSGSIGSDLEENRKRILPSLVFDLEKEDADRNFSIADIDEMPSYGDLVMDPVEPQIMTTQTKEIREHLYKILVIGELGTGKTSFIKRYVHQFFSQNYRATIGVDFALKVLHWDQNTIVRLQLWDIAGQERFGNMTRVYYKEAVGAFIVYDVTRNATFDCVSKWKLDLDSKVQLPDGSPIPCILLANKCDLENQGNAVDPVKMDEYCKDNNFAGWYETSAKENVNIDEAAKALVNKILLNDKLISASDIEDSEKINLGNGNGQSTAKMLKEKCSC